MPAMNDQNFEVQSRPQQQRINVIGVIGFVLSLVGLLGFCFLPAAAFSFLAVILCFIGMFIEPRGLAIAGFIIGLIGSALIALIALLFGGMLALGIGFAAMLTEANTEIAHIGGLARDYHNTHAAYPAQLSDLNLTAEEATDPWGNAYILMPSNDGQSLTIMSWGPDGMSGGDDDITSTIRAGASPFDFSEPVEQDDATSP